VQSILPVETHNAPASAATLHLNVALFILSTAFPADLRASFYEKASQNLPRRGKERKKLTYNSKSAFY
jgi:hypothetical protein